LHLRPQRHCGTQGRALLGLLALASLVFRFGDPDEAEALLRRGLARCPQVFGDTHECTLKSQLFLGEILLRSGRAAEAQSVPALARQRCRAVFGEHDAVTVLLSIGLATAHIALEELDQAETLLVETLPVMHEWHAGEVARISEVGHTLQGVGGAPAGSAPDQKTSTLPVDIASASDRAYHADAEDVPCARRR
jgi:hypothetical protein